MTNLPSPAGNKEKAILVHLECAGLADSADLEEFQALALSAGADVVGVITGRRKLPNVATFLGTGKVAELKEKVQSENADLVLFNHPLNSSQERNLERAIQCRVLDRTGLILDIFAQRARSFEGKLQVELAQLNHLSTRLVRGWLHLERQKGGIGLRGPGETQLEVDRRLIRGRMQRLLKKLEKVRRQRAQSRRARLQANVPTVALVGYTNAGKSTLFNALTAADAYVADQLFATLDPTLRACELPPFGRVVFADTVGFISHLPHELVKAFRATLEEVREADLLLHVIDATETEGVCLERIQAVKAVLDQLQALNVPQIEVYNKIDTLTGREPCLELDAEGQATRVLLSAKTKEGVVLLKQAVLQRLQAMNGLVRAENEEHNHTNNEDEACYGVE